MVKFELDLSIPQELVRTNIRKFVASYFELNKVLPPSWSKGNPVDILGDADEDRYKNCRNNGFLIDLYLLITIGAILQ